MAGGTVVLAVDNNATMLSLHHHNFPEAKHVQMELGGDVSKFAGSVLGLVGGRPWHLHGSPPCQSFSIAYRRGGHETGDDARTNLTLWYLRLVETVKAGAHPQR